MQLSLFKAVSWLNNPYALIDELHKTYGQSFFLKLPFLGNQLVTGDAKLIKQIISDKSLVAGKAIQFLQPLIGKHSIIMLDDDMHLKRHQQLSAYFFSTKIQSYDQHLVSNTAKELTQFSVNDKIAIHQVCQNILMKTIVNIIFGIVASKELDELTLTIKDLYQDCSSASFIFLKFAHSPLARLSKWGKFSLYMRKIRDIIDTLISQQIYHKDENCLLYHLLVEHNCDYSKPALIDEIVALLLFGHDTASATIAWAFFHIYQHPEAVMDVLHEIRETTANYGNRIIYPKLYACIQESMRLRPVVVHLSRIATTDHDLGNYTLLKNQRVLPSSYLAHHNKCVFENPNAFCPNRFSNGKEYTYHYFPFGLGHRLCIGKLLALRQMQIVMAQMIKILKLKLITSPVLPAKRHIVIMAPPEGARFVIEAIDSKE